jgi:hypothetical protein
MRFSKKSKYTIIIAALCVASLFILNTAQAGSGPEVNYSNGLLSVKAVKTPLLPVLESIGKAAGVEIFISKDIKPADISIQFADEPLEDALKRVLRGLSYAAVYSRDRESWRMTALKVFPEGRYSGEMVSILSKTANSEMPAKDAEIKTVLFPSGDEFRTYGKLGKGGNLIPVRSVPVISDKTATALNAPWFQLQKQFERKETRNYEELMLFERKLEAAQDPDRKEALAMAYADEVEKFHAMKKIHLNKIEALKRIYQAREMAEK